MYLANSISEFSDFCKIFNNKWKCCQLLPMDNHNSYLMLNLIVNLVTTTTNTNIKEQVHKPSFTKDAVSDLMHNWVAQRPAFKNAVRVIKKVQNTQCYQYLWLTMWFHAEKLKETLKKSKSLILQCKFGSQAQKWPKIAKKTDHSIAIGSILCIGMVYFKWLLVNPHVQAVQNMCGKGGVEDVSGWVRGSRSLP